jgi:hypothetical protein
MHQGFGICSAIINDPVMTNDVNVSDFKYAYGCKEANVNVLYMRRVLPPMGILLDCQSGRCYRKPLSPCYNEKYVNELYADILAKLMV